MTALRDGPIALSDPTCLPPAQDGDGVIMPMVGTSFAGRACCDKRLPRLGVKKRRTWKARHAIRECGANARSVAVWLVKRFLSSLIGSPALSAKLPPAAVVIRLIALQLTRRMP